MIIKIYNHHYITYLSRVKITTQFKWETGEYIKNTIFLCGFLVNSNVQDCTA